MKHAEFDDEVKKYRVKLKAHGGLIQGPFCTIAGCCLQGDETSGHFYIRVDELATLSPSETAAVIEYDQLHAQHEMSLYLFRQFAGSGPLTPEFYAEIAFANPLADEADKELARFILQEGWR